MIDFTAVKNLASKFTVTGAQKAHIDRLVFELGLLEKQVAALGQKLIDKDLTISKLQAELADLSSEKHDLRAKLDQGDGVADQLDEPTRKVLQLLFDVGYPVPAAGVAGNQKVSESVAMFHLDILMDRDFVGCEMGRAIIGIADELGRFGTDTDPDKYFIKPKGRAFIMKNG